MVNKLKILLFLENSRVYKSICVCKSTMQPATSVAHKQAIESMWSFVSLSTFHKYNLKDWALYSCNYFFRLMF